MKLTPLDIRHKDFKRGMRGYVDGEVDEFLDEIADEFERLFKENIELSERCDTLAGEDRPVPQPRRDAAEDPGLGPAERRGAQGQRPEGGPADPAARPSSRPARWSTSPTPTSRRIEKQIVVLKSSEEDFRFKFRSLLEGYLKQLVDLDEGRAQAADFAGKRRRAQEGDGAPTRPRQRRRAAAPTCRRAGLTGRRRAIAARLRAQVPPAVRSEPPAPAPAPAPSTDAAGEARREPAVDEGARRFSASPTTCLPTSRTRSTTTSSSGDVRAAERFHRRRASRRVGVARCASF